MYAATQKGSAAPVRRSGRRTSGAVGMAGGLGCAGSGLPLCALDQQLSWQREGSSLCPLDGDAGWGWARRCGAWFPGGAMHVMVFVRNEQNILKRPKKPKTVPRLRGPC